MDGEMGGEKKLSKFIVDWENGTWVACNNGIMVQSSGKCALTLHSCISVTDRVEQNKSIATGPNILAVHRLCDIINLHCN